MSPQLYISRVASDLGFNPSSLAQVGVTLAQYVDQGRLPGLSAIIGRCGETVFHYSDGYADRERGTAISPDTIFRVYSLTKVVTSVAVLIMCDRGLIQLDDPVSNYLPAFGSARVVSTSRHAEASGRFLTVRHLLTHTGGLAYGSRQTDVVSRLYASAGFVRSAPEGMSAIACSETLGHMPLLFEPGSEWNYSLSTDVLGWLIEVVSGANLADFIHENICLPLQLSDTGFFVRSGDVPRLAALYRADAITRRPIRDRTADNPPTSPPSPASGGGGLFSSPRDYHRFIQMLANGGELSGIRILKQSTVEEMTKNHLPGGKDLAQVGRTFSTWRDVHGVGFGLGVAVVIDANSCKDPTRDGEFSWEGSAGTAFFVDKERCVTAVVFSQLHPTSAVPICADLRRQTYLALTSV